MPQWRGLDVQVSEAEKTRRLVWKGLTTVTILPATATQADVLKTTDQCKAPENYILVGFYSSCPGFDTVISKVRAQGYLCK